MKFSQKFYGVKSGDIYPTDFEPGDDCPPELEDAARDVGALSTDKGGPEVASTKAQPAPRVKKAK